METLITHFHYYLGIFIVLVLGGLGFPFPEGVTLLTCGFFIGSKIVDPFLTFLFAYSGVLTGDFLSFYVGRKYGHSLLHRKMINKILSTQKLSAFENQFKKFEIPFMLVANRLMGGVSIAAGIIGISLKKFLIVDIVSALAGIIISFGIGYAGGNSFRIVKTGIMKIQHITALLLLIILVLILINIYFRPKSQRK